MRMSYTTNEKVGRVRIQAIRLLAAGKSTREVARYLGYAQSTIVKWSKRKNECWHQQSLPTRSSRPHTSPRSISKELVAKIIAARKETKRCAEVVYEKLKMDGVAVSLSTVKRTLSRYGLLKKRSPWKRVRTYPIRPDIALQGDLVEIDTIHFMDKHRKRSYVYTAIDLYSRYGFALLSKKADTHHSIVFFQKIREYFPFEVKCIQTDNGPEFGAFFSDFITRKNVTHRRIHPRSPNENGHVERFNRTLQEEIPRHSLCMFIEKDMRAYLKHYNSKRMHMGIKFKTPQQMLKE